MICGSTLIWALTGSPLLLFNTVCVGVFRSSVWLAGADLIASWKKASATTAPLKSSLPPECVSTPTCLCESVITPSFFSPSVFHPGAEFREPRVIELWEAAKRANLSKDELDSLKVIPDIAHRRHQTCASTDLSPEALPVKDNSWKPFGEVLLLLKGPLILIFCS